MPRFAANLSMLYNEHDFLDRFEAAARDGFEAVEFLFPYAFKPAELAQRLADHGLQQVLFNAPPGDWDTAERGIACLPGREAEFRSGIQSAMEYAQVLNCPRVHVMAGLAPAGVARATLQGTYEANLAWAAAQALEAGLDILVEPINTRDIPGFFLNRQDEAHRIVGAVGASNLKVQMDLYHCQIVEGDVATKIRQYLPTGKVGHFQIAGVPMRHEPDLGELNHPYLFDVIDEVSAACGWQGWIGCEYRPARGTVAGSTSTGLDWLRARR
ncbi:MAG: hydroxypyruvate isomerase family protein [Rhodoferax sp.]|nr:hydroxypyruvate isomerase family protein [Rhodoferax sp.]MBP9931215.1 hydroxypyruvate isomerase family protein [Rhodoferax sp.]HQX58295.1 hydroxypyruvate isomerase family protein [Burkholderiaceae bacterium]HRA62205.1 hydroxypyruvate isomerase family protein [Burkholderiaceae bacterium]